MANTLSFTFALNIAHESVTSSLMHTLCIVCLLKEGPDTMCSGRGRNSRLPNVFFYDHRTEISFTSFSLHRLEKAVS